MLFVRNAKSSLVSRPGAFIISLDFELHWGLFDHTPLTAESREYFLRARRLIPPTLRLFADSDIAATWATVGMLFARDRRELEGYLPHQKPHYEDPRLNPYTLLPDVGESEDDDPYHYAPSLICRIAETPGQAIGTHTFSHYYCLEPEQSVEAFRQDIEAAQRSATAGGYARAASLVFPRNQYHEKYFPAARQSGIRVYRGNPEQWFWKSRSGGDTTLHQRAVRLADNYLPIAGQTTFQTAAPAADGSLLNVPASRFFRPYIQKIDGYGGQALKVRRILKEMERAAIDKRHYHLWWHPHNLATHPEKNMAALERICAQSVRLRDKYGWESHSMESFSAREQDEPKP